MTQSEHTPGPWRWVKVDTFGSHEIIGSNNEVVCDDGSAHGEYREVLDPNGANARLIVAAPKLLDALESAVNFYVSKVTSPHMGEACANGFPLPENIDWPPHVIKAHSAIVKARKPL